MKIFTLSAEGPWNAHVGVFTSKAKADKAWRLWKYALRGTHWQGAKKILTVAIANTFLDNRKV